MSNQPSTEEGTSADSKRRLTFRWQYAILAVGLLLAVAAVIYSLSQSDEPGAEEEIPVVQPIDFVDTQTFSEAVVGQPLYANPLLAVSQADRDLVALVFSGLTRLDDFGQPAPDLAQGWEVSPDGLTYIFHLREDVTWHDGQPFTSEDVAYTMAVLRDLSFPGEADLAAFWRTVETYADDDYTVRFVLTQPLAAFPEYAGIGILPAHLLAEVDPADLPEDSFNLAPVGTGRLRWVSSELLDGAMLVHLEPYGRFYDEERQVSLEAVDLYFYKQVSEAFRALGPQVQALGGLTPSQLNAALGSANLSIYTARLPVYGAVIFNLQASERLPFFQDERVRQALVAGLDRETILGDVLGRTALVADSPLLPGTWAYNPELEPIAYNPSAAAQLLDEAGWRLDGRFRSYQSEAAGEGETASEGEAPAAVPLAFTLLVSSRDADRALGEALAEQWLALGVDVSIEALPPADLLSRLQTTGEGEDHAYDAALVEFSQGRLADPDPYNFWHESQIESGQNYSGLADRDISEALEIARKDPNGVRRAELYKSFQQWFIERAVAVLLYNPTYNYALSCQVEGPQLMIFVNPSDRFRNMHEWQIAGPADRDRVCPG
jgi:peptide/nickel transport system substrate-binding protein